MFRLLLTVPLAVALAAEASAQIAFDREPILYSSPDTAGPAAALQQRIDSGELKLEFDEEHGYLKSLLKALDVPVSSQMLVFSKTSFQLRRISPSSPRALYFNDDIYIGWVPHGDVIEVSSVDPRKGAIFYTLAQEKTAKPRLVRDKGNCLTCHASSRTHNVPGHLVRSVYPSPSGQPHFGSGTFRTNHESPLKERWGGWYVSGTHGEQRHMGNVISERRDRPESLDVESGANLTDLRQHPRLSRLDRYLSSDSDIVALMVLEHQTDMHNLITHAGYETRMALHQNSVMNKALDRPADYISDSAQRRINSAAGKLLKYLLFAEETPLTDEIRGTSEFAAEFAGRGRHDDRGRSLRDFDLRKRIFKHPCSYLIHSEAFRELPPEVKQPIYRRLWEILTGADQDETFAHLSSSDRRAILEILRDTSSDLPDYWR